MKLKKKGRDVRIKESGICTSGSQELHHPVHLDNRMLLGGDAGQRREPDPGENVSMFHCSCVVSWVFIMSEAIEFADVIVQRFI